MAELSQILVGATNFTNTDTKNTAGSTDTSSKIFLIGATSQAANPQTYSQDTAYVGTDGCLYSGGSKVLTSHQSVTNKDTTLAWSTKSTIATIGSTDITVSLPANPNTDTKVTQSDWADDVNHRVLFSYSDASGDITNKVYKSSGFVYNPYNKKLNIGSLNATSSFISLMADSTDGANVQFSDNTGDVLFKFNSSDQDGYLMLGNATSKKRGSLTLVSSSGSMCTLTTQSLSNFRTIHLPDATGTLALSGGTVASGQTKSVSGDTVYSYLNSNCLVLNTTNTKSMICQSNRSTGWVLRLDGSDISEKPFTIGFDAIGGVYCYYDGALLWNIHP